MKEKLLEKLKLHFKDSIESINEFRTELTIFIKNNDIVKVCKFLHDDEELRFDSLRDVCGVDQNRMGDRYEVIYNLFSLRNKFRLRLKVRIDENNPHIPTVTCIWPAANYSEREAYDMFGIIFEGHPDLRRIYMPEEFEYHPLRKDFPLTGLPGSLPLPRK